MRCGQEIHLKCGDTRQLSKMRGAYVWATEGWAKNTLPHPHVFGTFPKHPLNALSPVPIIRKVNMVGHSNMLVSQDGQSNMVV